jgi:hypothetical protein
VCGSIKRRKRKRRKKRKKEKGGENIKSRKRIIKGHTLFFFFSLFPFPPHPYFFPGRQVCFLKKLEPTTKSEGSTSCGN